jgi:hypothetical protein
MTTIRYFDQRERFSENPDVFSYDELTAEFRQKVAYLFGDLYSALADKMPYTNEGAPEKLFKRELARALGAPGVPNPHDYFVQTDEVSPFFIGVEVALNQAAVSVQLAEWGRDDCRKYVLVAVERLNTLIAYHALGYEAALTDDSPLFQVMRKDTAFTHAEMVKPTLRLLSEGAFDQANQQFRDAHREFTLGNYADAITDAASAVESVLKNVLKVEDGTASALLDQAGSQGYFPTYLMGSIGQWKTLLLGTANIRNKMGDAHGRTDAPSDEAEHERCARLALNLAASFMLFILDGHRSKTD